MRIFGSDRISGLLARFGMSEGVPLEHRMVTRAIERAQKQVEGQNFTIRKHLLEYDDVMNKQRESVYRQRMEILRGKDLKEDVFELVETLLDWILENNAPQEKNPEDWDLDSLKKALAAQFGLKADSIGIDWQGDDSKEIRTKILQALRTHYEDKERLLGPEAMREFERIIMLQVIDTQWKDHLLGMDYLKEGIGLRGYGQRDPLVEYKKESYDMFQAMMDRVEEEALRYLFLLQPVAEADLPQRKQQSLYYQQPEGGAAPPQRAKQARSMIPSKKKRHH
jgi:preprotein translocase subunit SecA